MFFETGRNSTVDNLLFGEGGVDSCHLLSHTVRVTALIFVQRRCSGPLFQNGGGPFDNRSKHGMIGRDECSQHFREYIDSAPLVVCQYVDRICLGKDQFRFGADFYFQASGHTLGQLGEIIGGQEKAE